jgi:hypothetical protein
MTNVIRLDPTMRTYDVIVPDAASTSTGAS